MLTRPEYVSEQHGQEAIELAASVGLRLDPWQELFVRVTLAEREGGTYAASEVGLLVARQNGKGAALEAVVLDALFLVGDPLTLWTAHEFKTCSESFLRIKGWLDSSDDLRRRVRKVTTSHGEEGVELTNGSRLRFLARSKSSGRGFSPQRIIWDEAQELSSAAVDAALPSMRAQRNKQSIFVGTAPGPATNYPEHFTRMRTRGRAASSPRQAWLEWSPDGSSDPETARALDLDDRAVWAQANPGLGYREGLSVEALADDREQQTDDSFGRETLSIWPTLSVESLETAVDVSRWAGLCDVAAKLGKGSPVALAVDVRPGRDRAAIAVVGQSRKSRRLLALVKCGSGTDWVVGETARLVEKHADRLVDVALDPGGPAGTLLAELSSALEPLGVTVRLLTARTLAHACGGFLSLVEHERLAHVGQRELDAACKASRTRKVGDGETWDRADTTADISPLVAVSIAAQGYTAHELDDYDVLDSIG